MLDRLDRIARDRIIQLPIFLTNVIDERLAVQSLEPALSPSQ